jgi:hypothetical protein
MIRTLLLLALLGASVLAAQERIAKTSAPIVIDGVLDEKDWRQATAIRADYVFGKEKTLSDEPHMTVKYAWDEHFLYIAYETFDRNLTTLSSGQKQGPADNQRAGCIAFKEGVNLDVVEFFIAFGDKHFFWELHHNAANEFSDCWCNVIDKGWPIGRSRIARDGIVFNHEEFLPDDGAYKLATAVKLKDKSSLNDSSDQDAGYTAELRIPWVGLGAPVANGALNLKGQKVSILAVTMNGDLQDCYHHSAPKLKGVGYFHKKAAAWPKYKLSE